MRWLVIGEKSNRYLFEHKTMHSVEKLELPVDEKELSVAIDFVKSHEFNLIDVRKHV